MRQSSINIVGYDVDIPKLLSLRLLQTGVDSPITREGDLLSVKTDSKNEEDGFLTALALLLGRDLMHMELADIVNAYPLSLTQKQNVLAQAVRDVRNDEKLNGTRKALSSYYDESDAPLNLKGFMRFRMPEVTSSWRRAAQKAVEEVQLEEQYLELMGVLRTFVEAKPSYLGEVSLCLHPDGGYTLTDDSDARIEYKAIAPERMISILVGLSPSLLTVYDLSGGEKEGLTEALSRVFAGRVRFFR